MKDSKALAGSIGSSTDDDANIGLLDNDGEIGFWIGPEYWGNGYATEALRSMVDRAFGKRHVQDLWCCHLAGNKGSRRVQEKCGFTFHPRDEDCYLEQLESVVIARFTKLEKASWLKKRKAKAATAK